MMKEILVIDSEERETFWITLKSDYKILFATAAKKGLNMLSANIDLVFLSIRVPDMNSVEVRRLIKKEYPSIAVIIIASSETEEMYMETIGKDVRDVRDYVRKPLKTDEILQKIKLLMSESDISHYPDVPSHLVSGVLEVRDFITQNYSESLSLAAACKMASVCKTYFCRFFKHITGHSLRNYHHVVKIQIAEELLQDKRLSVTDVALRLGYNDSNYFSTVYKRITGISPRQRQRSKHSQGNMNWSTVGYGSRVQ